MARVAAAPNRRRPGLAVHRVQRAAGFRLPDRSHPAPRGRGRGRALQPAGVVRLLSQHEIPRGAGVHPSIPARPVGLSAVRRHLQRVLSPPVLSLSSLSPLGPLFSFRAGAPRRPRRTRSRPTPRPGRATPRARRRTCTAAVRGRRGVRAADAPRPP